eukprot:1160663-Pelagomonas_calceolata.AAC.5
MQWRAWLLISRSACSHPCALNRAPAVCAQHVPHSRDSTGPQVEADCGHGEPVGMIGLWEWVCGGESVGMASLWA